MSEAIVAQAKTAAKLTAADLIVDQVDRLRADISALALIRHEFGRLSTSGQMQTTRTTAHAMLLGIDREIRIVRAALNSAQHLGEIEGLKSCLCCGTLADVTVSVDADLYCGIALCGDCRARRNSAPAWVRK